jgi:nucleotide-binding universal stress UspA family protein
MLVPVEPSAHLDGIVAEPLLETADELSRLLADARGLVARTCTIDVRTVARDGNPAEELLRGAAANADLIVTGRSGTNFNRARFSARWPFASSSSRDATSSSPEQRGAPVAAHCVS